MASSHHKNVCALREVLYILSYFVDLDPMVLMMTVHAAFAFVTYRHNNHRVLRCASC